MSIRYLSGINVDANTLFVDSANDRVGIGTASPSEKFSLYGGDAIFTQFTGAGNGSFLKILNSTTTTNGTTLQASYFGSGGFGDLKFEVGGSERLRITSAGNVGIGTTSPNYKLDVNGSINIYTGNSLRWGSGDVEILNSGYSMLFSTYTGSALTEKMRITSGGSVLIATSTNPYTLGSLVVSHDSTLTRTYFQRGVELIEIVPSDGTGPNIISSSYTSSGSAYKPLSLSGRQNNADLYLATNGNIGIGTTNPGAKLDVNGDAWFTNGGSLNAIITQGAAGKGRLYLYDGGNATIALQTNGASYFNAGNVGIGTTSPSKKLQIAISDSAHADEGILLQSPSGYGEGAIYHDYGQSNGITAFKIWNTYTGSQIALSQDSYSSTGSPGSIRFYTSAQGTANVPTERMRITSAGSVGIGTTNPLTALHVIGLTTIEESGNIAFYGGNFVRVFNDQNFNIRNVSGTTVANISVNGASYFNGGNVGIGTTSPVVKLQVDGTITSTGVLTAYTSVPSINIGHNGDSAFIAATSGGGADTPISFSVGNNNEKMRITSAGNVGIGTTSPANTLQIGSVGATGYSGNKLAVGDGTNVVALHPGAVSYLTANGDIVVGAGGNTTNQVYVKSGGNVGIGTTSPSQALHVSGNVRVTGAYYDSSNSAGSSGQVLSSTGSGTDWVSLSEISGVDGTGTANYVAKWSDADTIANSQIVDNGTNVGINNATPKTKLDINGAIGFGSKTMSMTDTFAAALTLNMNDHNGCYVKLTAFGDWSNHSTIAYLGEFFIQASAGAYNEPGIIIRQVDNTGGGDDIQAQIVDPAGTGTRDFVIQLKATSASNTPFTAYIQYEVRGIYNSVS